MATFSKTPPKSKVTFRRTEKPLTDDELRRKNETAAKTIAEYDRKISDGGYMSADDLAAYKNATTEYVGTGNSIAKRSGQADTSNWQQVVNGLNDRYNTIYNEYAKYSTQEDWDTAMAASKAAAEAYQASLAFDVGAGKKRLAEMQGIESGDYAANKSAVMASAYDSANLPYSEQQLRAMEYETMALEDKYGFTDSADLRSKIKALEKQISEAETNQALNAMETNAISMPDFSAKSRYVSTIDTNDNYDVQHELINHRSSGKDVITVDRDYDKLSAPDEDSMAWVRDLEYLTKMSEDEVKVYNYFKNNGDEESAKEYLSLLEGSLYSRRNADQAKIWKEFAAAAPLLASATSVMMAPVKGTAYIGQLAEYVMTGKVNENAAYNDAVRASSNIRAARGEAISKAWDKALGENWGKVGNFGYQLGMSMGDFLLTAGVSGGNETMALSLMGAGAAADATIAAKSRGLDDGHALALGTIAGAAEVVSEKIGWDALFDSALRSKSKVTYLLKNAFSEGLEEPTSSVINTLADLAISGDQAELRVAAQELIDQGVDPNEAWGKVFGDYAMSLGVDALGGLLSGAAMGGGSIAINAVSTQHQKRKADTDAGNVIIDKGDVASLQKLAKELPASDDISKLIESVEKKATPAAVGRLYTAVLNQVDKQTKTELKKALEDAGVSREKASASADALTKFALGQTMTEKETNLMTSIIKDKKISAVYENVINNPDSVTGKRLLSLREAATKKATEKAAVAAKENAESELKQQIEQATEISEKMVVTGVGKNASVSYDGGESVPLADADFNNNGQLAVAYHAVTSAKGMTTEGANMILGNPKAFSTPGFIQEALKAYNGGRNNVQNIAQKLDASVIAPEEARALFEAGRDAASAYAKASEDAVYNAYQKAKGILQKTGIKPVGKLRIADDVDVDGFNSEKTYSSMLAAEIAPMLSVDIVLYNGADRHTFGYYKASEDAIYLNVNSRWNKHSMMLFTMSHELVHRAKLGSPKQYQAFADYLIAEYGKKGIDVDALVNQQMDAAEAAGIEMDEDEAFEEVVCDAAQRMLTDTDAGKKLTEWGAKSQENASIVAKIKELLTELLEKLRAYFKRVDSDSEAANAFRKLDKNVQQILADIFVDMSTDAAEKLGTIKAAGMLDQLQVKNAVEETATLVAFHNTTEALLNSILNDGGVAMPSVAVAEEVGEKFGDISAVLSKETIDPDIDPTTTLFGADAWTPQQSAMKMNAKFNNRKVHSTVSSIRETLGDHADLFAYNNKRFAQSIRNADGVLFDAFGTNLGFQAAYALEKGLIDEIPTKNGVVDKTALQASLKENLHTHEQWGAYRAWCSQLSDQLITDYRKATKEEALRNMQKKPASTKTFNLSENGKLIVPATQYFSIDQMRRNKGRLSINAEEANAKTASDMLRFAKQVSTDTKAVVAAINQAFDSRYNVSEIANVFKNAGISITTQQAETLQDLYRDAVENPTEYFEAKPGGWVTVDSIRAVVMPEGKYDQLRGRLAENGISVIDYKAGDRASRQAAVNSIEGVKFKKNAQIAREFLRTKDVSYNLAAAKTHKDSLASEYKNAATVTLDTLTQRYNKILDIWNRVSINLNSAFLDEWNSKVGTDRAFDVFKAQSGYKYNIELSTMCKKGVALFEAIDTIVRKEVMSELGTDVLGKTEKEILYDILKSSGFEIPCAICYVEQARQREGVIIDSFLNGKGTKLGWNSVLDSIENRMHESGSEFSFSSVSRSIASDNYSADKLNMDKQTQGFFFSALMEECNKEISRYNKAEGKSRQLIKAPTREAITAALKGNVPANLKVFKVLSMNPSSRFRIDGDLLYSSATTRNLANAHQALYSLFNSQGGVSGYKTKQTPVAYWGDLLEKKWRPSDLRRGGGIRNQSNSDAQMYTLLDQVQMYIDLTAKGYYLQAYTKVISELKLLGLSNAKINASLIPKVVIYYNADGSVNFEKTQENAGLDENGNPIFDDFEGIDHNEAFMLLEDPNYSKSIGGVCIGYSDKHIWKLLDDPRIQLVIGFHDKTNNPDKRYRGARYAKNYNGLNEAKQLKADGKYETVHVGFSAFLNQAEKMFYFNKATESFEGTITHNGKEYNADDIPKLAADLYLEKYNVTDENGVRESIPAYDEFKDHENYYKLLADFSLYDAQGHYAPHRKVAYNMPDTVPYLDENGNKQTMRTEEYIQAELKKELEVRDQLALALSDESADGIIPQFRAALRASEKMSLNDDIANEHVSRKISAMASRQMLADAFEGMIQSEDERKLVDTYRRYLDAAGDLEAPLVEVRKQIAEKVKAKAPKEEIAALRKQAASMQTALDANDAALLSLEAAQPIRDLMDKASKAYAKKRVSAARQKANERTDRLLEQQRNRYDQRLLDQREKYEEKLDAQKKRYQDMRKDASQHRKEAELRGKITRFKQDLQSTLEGKKGKQFVPRSLFEAMVNVCELIDTDSDLYKKDGSINKAQQKRDAARDRLRKLRDLYKQTMESDEVYQGEYDEYAYGYIEKLEEIVEGKKLTDLNLQQLEELYNVLKGIKGVLMGARELIGWKKGMEVHAVADSISDSQLAILKQRKSGKRSALAKFNDDIIQNQSLSPIRYVEKMAGYDKDSALVKLMTDLEDGVRKKNQFVMESYKMFDLKTEKDQQWFEDAQHESGKYYTDIYGRNFRISLMQKMQAVLSYERELANENLHHVMGGGFIFADVGLLEKGKMAEAISKEYAHQVKVDDNLIASFMQEIRADLDSVAYLNRARRFFNEKAKNALNEASMAVKHRLVATEDAYIPFSTDETDVVQEIDAAHDVQKTINGYGILKDLKAGAQQALYITGLNNVIDRHIEQVGTVYGLAVPTRNFNKVWNAKSENIFNKDSVKGVIQLVWGKSAEKLVTQAVQDVQGPRQNTMPAWQSALRSNIISSTFLLNLSVVTKQIGSLYAANSELYSARNPVAMMANLVNTMAHYDQVAAEIDQHTATAWMRRQGLSDEELHTLITETRKTLAGKYVSKKLGKMNPAKWITAMDSAVAMALWKYCKEDVLSANPKYQQTMDRLGNKKNLTDEESAELENVWSAIAHHYDNVVERTQSMSDSLHRPEIQKKSDVGSLLLATFKTDVYQTAGQLQVAFGRAMAHPTQENKRALGRTLYAVGMSAIWGQMMTVAFSLLRYKMKRYKDKEDELTAASFASRLSIDLFSEVLGYVIPLFGGELVDIVEGLATGSTSGLFDDIVFSGANDLITSLSGITSKLASGKEITVQQWKKLAGLSLSMLGIPANNIIRIWEAVQKHIKDWADGILEFDQ